MSIDIASRTRGRSCRDASRVRAPRAPVQQGTLANLDEDELPDVSALDGLEQPERSHGAQADSRVAESGRKIVLSVGRGMYASSGAS